MAFMNKRHTSGQIWMLAKEETAFTKASVDLGEMDLTDAERKTLDDFDRFWATGFCWKPHTLKDANRQTYWDFLALCEARGVQITYKMKKAPRELHARWDEYVTPVHFEGEERGNWWPKKKPKGKENMTRAQIRAEQRRADRAKFMGALPPEQIERNERRREIVELKSEIATMREKLAGVDELANAVIDLQDEIKAMKAERNPQYRGAVHHRMNETRLRVIVGGKAA